jgi:hypothetical protein
MKSLSVTFALSLLAWSSPSFAQTKPTMTKAEAKAYLAGEGVDVLPDNLTQQIVTGNVKGVDALVVMGVDVNAKGDMPQTSLEMATMTCAGGRVKPEDTVHIMSTLLSAGANPNAIGMEGMGGVLTMASQQCAAPVVKLLLGAGAKLDVRTPQGFTPLSMALLVKNYDAASALIAGGAKLSPEAAQKFTQADPDDKELASLVASATKAP